MFGICRQRTVFFGDFAYQFNFRLRIRLKTIYTDNRFYAAFFDYLDMSNQIATAAEEQSQVAEEMDRSIVNIADVATRTTQSAQDTVVATEEISSEIQRLHTLMGKFKTT